VILRAGDSQRFFATVSGAADFSVTWSVNGKPGGDPTVGTIDSLGNYTAPTPAPAQNNVQIKATSVADSSKSAPSQATLLNPIAVVYLFSPPTLTPNAPFSLSVTGTKFINGAQVMFGATPVATTFIDSSHLSLNGTAPSAGVVTVTVVNPVPDGSASVPKTLTIGGVSQRAAIRFLEQSTFGPVLSQLTAVETGGMEPFLSTQFQAPVSQYPDPDPTLFDDSSLQVVFFQNAMNSQASSDQLRQRTVFALNQIWVISGNKVSMPKFFTPYLRVLNAIHRP